MPVVRKRDGETTQPFDLLKIAGAIRKAWTSAEGLVDETKLATVVQAVEKQCRNEETIEVESIQDTVEVVLMRHKLFSVAKSYILYRSMRSAARPPAKTPDQSAISNYIHFSKYAKFDPNLGRREMYEETVARVENMHLRRFAHVDGLAEDIKWAFDQVREKRVLPSMRSMQFAGQAIEAKSARIYNCAASPVDRTRVFAEALFLLLCGTGTGYSVQYDHVDKLPTLVYVNEDLVVHHTIKDSIEGWADALDALIVSYVRGYNVEFNYSKIRDKGEPLKTSGGRAPGHRKLKTSLDRIRAVLQGAQGRKLRPIECHDIMCHSADAVLSGGIRRSAMIALFSLEDSEMMYAKTGNWWVTHPWRANANNSVVLKRDEVKKKQFKRIFNMTKEFGEPGFNFTNDINYLTNPCFEIGLFPFWVEENGDVKSGWAFCNLCEINAAKLTSSEDMMSAARAAAIIGTLQASYTDMPYLGKISENIAKRDALLGVGMTGMLDSTAISCDPVNQRKAAALVNRTNVEFAARIGINSAARTTCVKPSGTTSLELGGVASGHHPHHAKKYIRRVIADELETVFQTFRAVNPHMCVRMPDGKWVVEFPVLTKDGATIKSDITSLEFLDMIKSTQQNWVLPGTNKSEHAPDITHNVSNTVTVKKDEWDVVAEYLWTNKALFTGVSLLAETGDKDYAFAPFEAVTTEADELRFNQLVNHYLPVDYTLVTESGDETNLTGEVACAGGACLV